MQEARFVVVPFPIVTDEDAEIRVVGDLFENVVI